MKDLDRPKQQAAERALDLIRDGQVIGLGTGSTAKFAIEGLGRLVRDGLSVKGVPTSVATERLARELAIPLVNLNEAGVIDVTLDGADEVDPDFNMIKGGGGALTREKLVALASVKRIILVDESKLVSRLGQSRLLPIEVLPFAWTLAARLLTGLGCVASLREHDGVPFVTDNGNHILDCAFGPIEDAATLEKRIKLLPGVIECGLFIGIADTLVIGFDGRVEVRERPA
ncbi:MAG TPA: ribose-5-phosphate isomerase RpiA [Blastocatellia bacterium]|nr:ribose-5-phosphate isomerase RpiA [Blastocatellia bacterium]